MTTRLRIPAHLLRIAPACVAAAVALAGNAQAGSTQIFDELRFGASASIQGGRSHEDGLFPEVSLFFDPFGARDAKDWTEQLARPRFNIGTSVGVNGEATQVFSGLDWKVNFTRKAFIEAGFGGLRDQRPELRPLQDLRHQGPQPEHQLGAAAGRRRAGLSKYVKVEDFWPKGSSKISREIAAQVTNLLGLIYRRFCQHR